MKKAGLNLSLETIIGLILIAILIPGLVAFVTGITTLVINKPDQSTYNSFDALVLAVQDLVAINAEDVTAETLETTRFGDIIKPSEKGEVYVEIPYYLKKGVKLIGFDSDKIKYNSEKELQRPEQCFDKVCLCIASGIGNSEKNYQKCSVLEKVSSISSAAITEDTIKNIGSAHGKGYYLVWDAVKEPGVRNIKIIKIPSQTADSYDIFIQLLPSS